MEERVLTSMLEVPVKHTPVWLLHTTVIHKDGEVGECYTLVRRNVHVIHSRKLL